MAGCSGKALAGRRGHKDSVNAVCMQWVTLRAYQALRLWYRSQGHFTSLGLSFLLCKIRKNNPSHVVL